MEWDLMSRTAHEEYHNILMTLGCGTFAEVQLPVPHLQRYSTGFEDLSSTRAKAMPPTSPRWTI